ncbi:leukotriene B4 receptor 1-like [Astyanax mexicanus]|uniref:Leukotriene B4 receptor 1-like n=2 Tax=Astyanax mexicanus TaxID=7994 RepID=A0A8T2LTV1_ASTMX|nr:leukotriene B4 receptor 1-like [Astyanax mexicanus]KAG9273252.1 leukotriene B4 receptor 1-like [Astyanax mexicanus]
MDHLNYTFNSTCDPVLVATNRTLGAQQVGPSVLLAVCCLVGLPSNIAVIVTITRQWSSKISFTVKLMLSLAVSDSITLGLVPFGIYSLLCGWTLDLWACRIVTFLTYCAMYAGVLTVTLMAVHHYHTVKSKVANRHQIERLQRSRLRLLLFGLWGLAIVFAVPIFFTRGVQMKRGLPRCQRSIDSVFGKVTILLFEVILGFVLPFSTILTSYCWINKTKLREGRGDVRKRKARMRRLVISIVTAFFLFWTPVHIINLTDVASTLTKTSSPAVYSALKTFRRATGDLSKTLSVINCCVNPFLYAVASGVFTKKKYKQEKKR